MKQLEPLKIFLIKGGLTIEHSSCKDMGLRFLTKMGSFFFVQATYNYLDLKKDGWEELAAKSICFGVCNSDNLIFPQLILIEHKDDEIRILSR